MNAPSIAIDRSFALNVEYARGLILIKDTRAISATIGRMVRSTTARIAFVAAALLAVAMLLLSCGAWDAHAAAAPDEATDPCCAAVHDAAAVKQVGAGPAAKGAEMPVGAPVFSRSPGHSAQFAVPQLASEALPRSSFYARSARILR